MHIATTKISIPAKKKREILQTIRALSELTMKEDGCRSYNVYQEIGSENEYCVIEEWTSWEKLQHYIRSDRFKILMGSMSLLKKTPNIKFSRITQTDEAETLMLNLEEMLLENLSESELEEENESFQR